jgi:hypothetical protein
MSKHSFICPYKIAVIIATRHRGKTVCGYSMSLVECSGRYTYENGNGTVDDCEVHGHIPLPRTLTMDNEEKAIRSKLMAGECRPPTADYTMARYLPASMSVNSVPVTIKNLIHGLHTQKHVEW